MRSWGKLQRFPEQVSAKNVLALQKCSLDLMPPRAVVYGAVGVLGCLVGSEAMVFIEGWTGVHF